MKREHRTFIMLTAMALLFVCANHALAQTDSARNSGQQQPNGDSGSEMPSARDDAAGPRSETASQSAGGSVTPRLVARVRKLQETMVRKLELDEKQLAAVNNLVEEFIRTLGVPEFTQKPSDPRRIELKRLRAEMTEAKKRGDSAAFESLRRERIKRILQLPQGSVPTAALIQSIDGVLHETQRGEFRRILLSVHLDVTATLPPNALTTILRAARDPSLNLTDDQQTAIRKIVREEILAIPKERRGPEGMNDAVPAIRDRIISALTPSQGGKFRALLNGNDRNHRTHLKTESTERFETAAPLKKSASGKSASESNKTDKG